jgi:hypothetical protein
LLPGFYKGRSVFSEDLPARFQAAGKSGGCQKKRPPGPVKDEAVRPEKRPIFRTGPET